MSVVSGSVLDHKGGAPSWAYWQHNSNHQKGGVICCFQSSFRRGFAITCPTFWYWLVPASQVSEEVGCRHRRNLPSQERGQGRFPCPEAVLPADTEKQPHSRPQTRGETGPRAFLQVTVHSC